MFKSRNAHQGIHKRSLASVYHLIEVEDKSSLFQCPAELNEAGASLIFTDVDRKDVFISSIHGHAKGAGLVRSQSFPPEGWYKTTSKYILKISKTLNSEDCERPRDSISSELDVDLRCRTMMSELKDDSSDHTSPMMVETACVSSLVPEQIFDKPTVSESAADPSLFGVSMVKSLPGGGDAPAMATARETIKHSDEFPNVVLTEKSVSANRRHVPFLGIPPSGKLLVCGRRREMEDTAAIVPSFLSFGRDEAQPGNKVNMDLHFYGVFDGHGGSQASTYCMERLHLVIAEELFRVNTFGVPEGRLADGCNLEWEEVMKAAFLKMDKEVGGVCPNAVTTEDDSAFDGGCLCCEDAIAPENVGTTAVVAVVGSYEIVVANCGDSRAVLVQGGQAIPLSRDHKPELDDETRRIEAAGGRVICWDGYRVGGLLALSRAIGDRYLKRYVISEPEITCIQRSEDDDCLILGSDGLWDVVSNELACEVARKSLPVLRKKYASRSCATGEDAASAAVAALLVKLAYGRGSKDNISVVVVDLKSREMNDQS